MAPPIYTCTSTVGGASIHWYTTTLLHASIATVDIRARVLGAARFIALFADNTHHSVLGVTIAELDRLGSAARPPLR